MFQFTRLLFLGCFALIVGSGCASQTLNADVDPNTDLSTYNNFYVVKLDADKRGVEKMISAELNQLGKSATDGLGAENPSQYDAIVSYADKWMWDITMYMLELTIQFTDPETGYVLAEGTSYRTSLVRKTPEEMVAEVLDKMFSE